MQNVKSDTIKLYSSFCQQKKRKIKNKVLPSLPRFEKGQLFCNHLFSPPDCMTSEACEI